jgi:WD40 repeat protein
MAASEPIAATPKAFISYSWDDDAHKEWVRQLAIRLRKDGVDVTLDRWHAAPGDQIPLFMERAVRENDFVIAVCTPKFKERSDKRGGGVGYEGDIMTAYAFTDKDKKKFIPVLRREKWTEAAPTWLLGRAYIDLSGDPYSESEYGELLRTLHGEREEAPPIGPPPVFGNEKRLIEGLFFVPFPRNPDFVGRAEDLEKLHTVLGKLETVGIRPAGLTGMGGIGKTQLAVEYVYRYRGSYPDGVFWVNAAEPLAQGLAQIACRIRPEVQDSQHDEQLRTAFNELHQRKGSLLVLDNLGDPAKLIATIIEGRSIEGLRCRILFTTRERELGRFHPVELSVLPEDPALALLLWHPRRHSIRDNPSHRERAEARAICRLLGFLPLALELAGAFLGENDEMPLADYRARLEREGCITTIEAELENLSRVNFQPTHDAAIEATLTSQWDLLKKPGDKTARFVFQVAGQFGEAAGIPELSLWLLAGVSRAALSGHKSPLRRSLKRLQDVRLVEELREDRVRLHPLVREFAQRLTPPAETEEFRHACARRVVRSFENFASLEEALRSGGISWLERCLETAAEFSAGTDGLRDELLVWLRLFRREGHNLCASQFEGEPHWFAERVMFRAVTLGETALAARAERRLRELGDPALVLRWRTLRESPALERFLAGHQGSVNSVAVSPDGRRIVSGSSDNTVAVWDLETGSRLLTLAGHQDRVYSVAVSPDGRRIVSGSDDQTAAVWDLETGARLHTLSGHEGPVSSVAVSPDGRRIVSGSWDKTAAVWDLETGSRLLTLAGHQDGVTSVAVSSDGRRIVSGSSDNTLAVWGLETGSRRHTLAGHQGWVSSVAVSPDGRRIVSGSADDTVAVWDLQTGTRLLTLSGHQGGVTSVAVSPDGRRIVSGSGDTVAVWDLQTGARRHTLAGHQHYVNSVAVSPDGRRIVSGSYDKTVGVWDLQTGARRHALSGHQGEVNSVAVSPDGRRIVSGSADDTVAVWDLESGTRRHTLAGHQGWVNPVAVSPDGRRIVSRSRGKTAAVWDMKSGRRLLTLAGQQGWVNSVAVSSDGRRIVSGSDDHTVSVWDLETGNRLRTLHGHQGQVNSVAVSPDGRCIVSGSWDNTVAVWDLESGERLRTLAGHQGQVNSVAVSPDGRRIVSGSLDNTVAVWDLETGSRLHTLSGHDDSVNSVAVSPDGRRVVSGSRDETVAVWDLETGSRLTTLTHVWGGAT